MLLLFPSRRHHGVCRQRPFRRDGVRWLSQRRNVDCESVYPNVKVSFTEYRTFMFISLLNTASVLLFFPSRRRDVACRQRPLRRDSVHRLSQRRNVDCESVYPNVKVSFTKITQASLSASLIRTINHVAVFSFSQTLCCLSTTSLSPRRCTLACSA